MYVVASVGRDNCKWMTSPREREEAFGICHGSLLLFLILYRCVVPSHVVAEPFLQQVPYPLLAELWQDADNDQLQKRVSKVLV